MAPDKNRTRRWSAGPVEVYAYHDWPQNPWRSPLYVGVLVGPAHVFEANLPPDSPIRPFSGSKRPA